MKPIYISVDGILNKSKEYLDLTTKTANLVAITYQDIKELMELLALGLFGNGVEGKIELCYEYNGEEYIVKRDFDNRTAELSRKDAAVEAEGTAEVDNEIFAQLKMDKSSFVSLVAVDRDRIFDGFQLPAAAREEYISSVLDELMCNKEEIVTIEQKLQEKFNKTQLRIEIAEEVNPKELADLKSEINEKNILRQDIRTEMNLLFDAIKKADEAEAAAKQLEIETAELQKALGKQPLIDELNMELEKSRRAELIIKLVEKKSQINDRDNELSSRVAELAENIKSCEKDLTNGSKTVKNIEGVLVHCLERINELRKVLYKRAQELSTDGDFQTKVYNQINKYYSKEEAELAALNRRKAELQEEIEAITIANKEISVRFKEISRKAELKKAVREGAILEKEIALLTESADSAKNSILLYEKRLSELLPQISTLEQNIVQQQTSLKKVNSFILGRFGSKNEALAAAALMEQEFHKYNALIKVQEKEADAIENKIQENADGLKTYIEDMEALDKAKAGLDAYTNKIRGTIAVLEDAIQKLEIERKYLYKTIELEYGQKCPLCSSIVLKKNDEQKRAADTDAQLAKLHNELTKAKGILAEYEEKSRQVSFRNGELSARIKVSQAYIESLQESLATKKEYIKNALKQAGAKSSFDLAEKAGAASEHNAQLNDAIKEYSEIESGIKSNFEKLSYLNAERKRLEEEDLPRLKTAFRDSESRLQVAQKAYNELSEQLGGVTAQDRLEEMTLVEKEYDTLERALYEKRAKLDEIDTDIRENDALINIIACRKRNITISGKEYDYQQVIIKTIGTNLGDIVEEIRKSEEEAETIKIKLAAIKRVLARRQEEYNAAKTEYEALTTRLESDNEVLEQIMAEYGGALEELRAGSAQDLQSLILSPERQHDIKQEIAELTHAIDLREQNISRLKNLVEEGREVVSLKEENIAAIKALDEKYDDLSQKAAYVAAKRAELKSRAKQLLSLKEKLAKYKEKLTSLAEIDRLLKDKGDLGEFIIKLASKRLYSLTKGKYNLDIIDGGMELLDNSNGGKKIARDSYSNEEKLLVALVLGTSMNRTLIDMIGGEPFMLIFPLKERETNKEIASALASYSKKKSIMVVAKNQAILDEIQKLG